MSDWYTLDERRQPRPVDALEWATERDESKWRVARTHSVVGRCDVSTVFLGLDHRYRPIDPNGPPILFETMVFGGPLDQDGERYCTWEEAERGHRRWMWRVRLWPLFWAWRHASIYGWRLRHRVRRWRGRR